MEYRVLGSLDVRNGGGSLVLGSAKQRALLAVLLLNANQVVSRDRLIDELWGDEPPATAVQSVQVYVSRLRKLLPPETLLTRPPGYLLELEPDALDLQRFDRLFADGREALGAGDAERASRILHEALALWRGPALAEFAFEPFARTEIGRLDELRLAALEERIEADLALGRHADVIAELETLIADNPHRERLRGQLMLALYRSGRQAEALEAYRQTRSVLDALGIDPSERLRQLELSILTQDTALDVPHLLIHDAVALPGPLRIASPFPFVGRAEEFDTLRSMLLVSEQGEGGQVALIAGEAGSGKTRLARELAHDAAERGTLVLYGGSNVDVNVPYQPFVEALEFLVRIADPVALQTWLGNDSEIARLVPALGRVPVAPAGDADTARRRLHNEFAKLLADVSRQRPLLLVVDDLQWADASSVQLLRHLTRAAPEARIFVLATYRDRSEDVRPEVSVALADFSRLEGATRLRLRALNSDDVGEFIEQSSGASAAPELTEAVHTLTEGTPFLLCELWRALVDADTIEISDGDVKLTRSVAELGSPESVRDVVRFRLSRLAPLTSAMLEVASVAGTEFDLSVVGAASASLSAADEAVESGMIEPLPGIGVKYRFSHELVRRALYDRLAPGHRAELHLHVGEALEQAHTAGRERVSAELAHHFTLAAPVAGAGRAIAYNLLAATTAARSLGYDEAARHLASALELGIADSSERARAQLDLGTALLQSGKLPEAEAALARAIDDTSGDDGLRAHASILRNHVRLRTDEADARTETQRIAEDAIDTFTRLGDSGGLAEAWRLLSNVPVRECRWGASAEALEIALTHARRSGDEREVAKAVTWLVTALYYGPLPAPEAIERYGELLEDHRSDTYIHAIASCQLSGLLAMTGRFADARAAAQRGLATLDEFGLTIAAANGRAYVSDGERFSGDLGAAERKLLQAHELFNGAGDRAGAASITFELAAVLCDQGRYEEASTWAARGRAELEQGDVMTRVTGLSVQAKLAARAGRAAEAEAFARGAVELADETDALNGRAGAFASLGNVLALGGRLPEANAARQEAVRVYEAKGNSSAAAQVIAAAGSAAPA